MDGTIIILYFDGTNNINADCTYPSFLKPVLFRWKSQFDDSEASENETEMKGENLQSPEHKQPEATRLIDR